MKNLSIVFFVVMLLCASAAAQTTEFTYQGSLRNGGLAANGNFDFAFVLFDAASGGAQIGSTVQRLNVSVADGVFTVSLDFGPGTLPGADRFLDIAVRTAGGGAFTALSPRQKVNSAPYSVKSLNSTTADTATNAAQLGGIAANQYVVTTDPRMTDDRNPLPNSTNYIQNQNAAPQTSSNFNISGTGTANILSAGTQFNIGISRILSIFGAAPNQGLSVGLSAGTSGSVNTFFGNQAGTNTTGGQNSYFGSAAGQSNTTGINNSFFGVAAGRNTTTLSNNSYFGTNAGNFNTGSGNSYFGSGAGSQNTNGSENAFFGLVAGSTITTGNNLSLFGARTFASTNLTNAGAIGFRAMVTQDNSLILGSISGVNGASAATRVGIGTTAPAGLFEIDDDNTAAPETLLITGHSNAGFFPNFAFRNSRGTRTAPTATLSGDSLLSISAAGHNGTGFSFRNSQIVSQAAENFTASANGTRWMFLTTPNGSLNAIERMRIDQNGRIGIGTTAPEKELHLRGSGDQEIMIESSDVGGIKWSLQSSNAAANGRFAIIDRTANTNRFTILADGNVGLGTSAPTERLHVAGNGLFTGNLTVNSALSTSGTLSGNIVNAVTQYNIGGTRVLSVDGTNNLAVGEGTAATGSDNSFFGSNAGLSNTTGIANAFFGRRAGELNTTGSENAFFGLGAGFSNSIGGRNSFFGFNAGAENTTGLNNAFFGYVAGINSTTSTDNSFFGNRAGFNNTTGGGNTFFGSLAGNTNATGALHTVIGFNADVGANNLTNTTAIGSNAFVEQSNSLVLGSINGVNGAIASTKVGIGTTTPLDLLHVNGIIRVETLATLGSTSLCRNLSNQIASCSSSLRYKTNVGQFSPGLSFVHQLRPITFEWKDGGMRDVGFGAEDIAKIDPRFVTYNDKGEVEGVKYDRLSVVLINAVKEQQTQIERQQTLIDELWEKDVESQNQVKAQQRLLDRQQDELKKQRSEIDALKAFMCLDKPAAGICKEN